MLAALVTLPACGARNVLELGDTDGTGGTASGGTPTPASNGAGASSTGAGGAGGLGECASLVVAEPGPVVVGNVPGARDPQLAMISGVYVFLTFLEPAGNSSFFHTRVIDSNLAWPPSGPAGFVLIEAAGDYALVEGPDGPAALVTIAGESNVLADLSPSSATIDGSPFPSGQPLFLAGTEGRWFYATRQPLNDFDALHVGSYQPGSLPQTEEPQNICLGKRVLAAGVRSGQGFLGASAAPDVGHPNCESGGLGSGIDLYRYTSPPEFGGSLEAKYAGRFVPASADALTQLHLVGTSFGAWLVWQGAGLSAEVPPPPMAMRLDANGVALDDSGGIPLADFGWGGPVAVTGLGDTLIVAWADYAMPSAPLLMVQLVHGDGTLGPSTSVPTDVLWQTGPMRVAVSQYNSIFLTWEGGMNQTDVGMARIDCVVP